MTRYASETSVSVEKSRAEIETILRRYKASSFGYATNPTGAMIFFELAGRRIKFVLPMPDPKAREFTHTSAKGQLRSPAEAEKAWEQAGRQRWRALALVIKAKLEAVTAGITTIEDEFLAHTMLPDGSTVSESMQPRIEQAYRDGQMPPMLLEGPR